MSPKMATPVRTSPPPPREKGGGARPAALRVVPPPAVPHVDFDELALRWQLALDAGDRALAAAGHDLPPGELSRRRLQLAHERQDTVKLLRESARETGTRPLPWLPPGRLTVEQLGLPPGTAACVFDLDGVLTDSGLLHAWAWAGVFDPFLLELSEQTERHFVPFDRDADYRAYIDGRSRLEGIHAFLESRGIHVAARTAWSLATRKGETTARALQQRGVTALPAARRYLEAAGHAGLKRAVVSASASTLPMLEVAQLATLVDARVDADAIRDEQLHTPPAPDLLLEACRRVGASPERTVAFTSRPAGIAAALAAGATAIGVGDEELLRGFGAPQVVPALPALLDRRLLEGAETGS
jgi:beta-phosphoglucomutase-like phosphatase (HAD superfamily)